MRIGYARVSTTEQNLDLQRDALKAAGCGKIIEDTASGGKTQRAGLERVRETLRKGRRAGGLAARPAGPVAAAPDRADDGAGRGGYRFLSVTEAIDTTTPGGKLVFHIFGALAGIRAEPDPRTDARRAGSGQGTRPEGGAGGRSSMTASVPWRLISIARRSTASAKSAGRSASPSRRFTLMCGRKRGKSRITRFNNG